MYESIYDLVLLVQNLALNFFVRKTKNIANFANIRSFTLMNHVVTLISFFVFTAQDLKLFEQFRLKYVIDLTFEFPTASLKRSLNNFMVLFFLSFFFCV